MSRKIKDESILYDYKKKAKAKNFSKSIKKILLYLKPHIPLLVIMVLMSVAGILLNIFATFKMRDLTNYIADAATLFINQQVVDMQSVLNMQKVISFVVILGIMYGFSIAMNYLQSFLMAGLNQSIAQSLRLNITYKMDRLPLNYFDNTPHGDTLSHVTNDVDTISQSITQAFNQTFHALIQILIVSVVMFLMKWELALLVVATVPLSMIVIGVIVKYSQKYFAMQQKYLGAVNGVIEESFTGQQVIKAYQAEEMSLKKFNDYNQKLQKVMYRAQVVSGMSYPLLGFISKLGYVAVVIMGGILYTSSRMDMGTLIIFFIYINLFQQPLGQLGQISNVLQSLAASSERVFEFLEADEIGDENNKTLLVDAKDVIGNIEFNHVEFGYESDKKIIKDFSIQVKPGQKIAIVGKTGAGKTTLVNLLMRFYDIDSGSIKIDNHSIYDMKRSNVRNLFSMVLQDTWLFFGTLRDNLLYGNQKATESELEQVIDLVHLRYFVDNLPHGLDTMIDPEGSISTGQRQLIAIARAILRNTPMLILDEATSNIDTHTEKLIQDAMDHLAKQKTSFVIAHRLSTIKNADVILVMQDGKIVESGSHDDLLAQEGYYYNLYQAQFDTEVI